MRHNQCRTSVVLDVEVRIYSAAMAEVERMVEAMIVTGQ